MVQAAFKKIFSKIMKITLFISLLISVGRFLGEPYDWIDYQFAHFITEKTRNSVSQESLYDTYFYLGFTVVIATTVLLYLFLIKVYELLRRL